jgi:hypothetical protein
MAAIRQEGERVTKHGIEHMRKEGQAMADLAAAYAPHDEGYLEKAIKSEDAGGGRDGSGRFLRREVIVYVDPDMPGSGGARTVGDYAYLMHEGLAPYGDGTYNRGPGSVAKAATTGQPVGGKFLQRAVEKISTRLTERLARMLSLALK